MSNALHFVSSYTSRTIRTARLNYPTLECASAPCEQGTQGDRVTCLLPFILAGYVRHLRVLKTPSLVPNTPFLFADLHTRFRTLGKRNPPAPWLMNWTPNLRNDQWNWEFWCYSRRMLEEQYSMYRSRQILFRGRVRLNVNSR